MTIKYIGKPPSEDGIYLLKVNKGLVLADAYVFDGDVNWHQFGIDYDIWSHSEDEFELEVICELDLEQIAKGAK